MRFTALEPPPPTPTTLMQAPVRSPSSNKHRMVQHRLGQFGKTLQHGAAAYKHHARSGLPFITGAANFVAHEMDDFFGAWLKDVAQNAVCNGTWLARTHSHDFENHILVGGW